jgi:uncharacterized protein YndB with AHSA1/START domain
MLVTESVTIRRSPADVYAFVADYDNDPRWRDGVTEMTATPNGSVRDGTKVREVLRFGGRAHVTETTISDVVPGRSFVFQGAGTGGAVWGRRTVEPTAEGARLTTELRVTSRGALRVLEPLLAPMFRRATRRDLATLRGTLEAGADHAATSSSTGASNAAAAMRR